MHLRRVRVCSERFPSVDVYPFILSPWRHGATLELTAPVTFFIGENGSGKSTLLRAIAQACGIHIWEGPERSRYLNNPFENSLHDCLEIDWGGEAVPGSFFSAELFRHLSQSIDEWALNDPEVLSTYGGKSLLAQSHGQSHMAFFENRFKIRGLYFLDEPENALSPNSLFGFLDSKPC